MGVLQLNASKNGTGGGTGTIGGTIAAGQVAYGTAFNTIGGDALFTRAADGDTFLLKNFGGNEVAGIELDTASSGVVIGYFDTATLENATAAFSKGSDIQTIIGYNNPASNIQGNLIFNNAGNTLTWDLDTTDNVTDVITQGADIFGGGIKGTAIYRQDSGSNAQAVTVWGDVSPIFGFSEPSVYSGATNSDGTISVSVVVAPVFDTGLTVNYQENGVNNILGQLQLSRTGNTLTWDADTTDGITAVIEQTQNLLGFGLKGNAITYQDSATSEVSAMFIGDLSPTGRIGSGFLTSASSATGDTGISLIVSSDPEKAFNIVFDNAGYSSIGMTVDQGGVALGNIIGGGGNSTTVVIQDDISQISSFTDGLFKVSKATEKIDYFTVDIPNSAFTFMNGNVGINTTTPTGILDVIGANNTRLWFNDASNYFEIYGSGADDLFLFDYANHQLYIYCGDQSSYHQQANSFAFYNGSFTIGDLGGNGSGFIGVDNLGQLSWQAAPGATIVASGDLSAQSASIPSVASYLSDGGIFRIGGYVNITAVTGGVISLNVIYADENSQDVSQIIPLTEASTGAIGTTASVLNSNNSATDIQIRVRPGSSITVATIVTGGAVTYDVGATIEKLR